MPEIDLNALTLDELKKLRRDVDKAISGFEERRRREAMAAVEARAREMGFTLAELTGGLEKATPPRPPKYRHPENSALTWSGRGRQPGWIREAVAAGKPLEDFLIG